MAIKKLLSWITGDVSDETWPEDTSEARPVRRRAEIGDDGSVTTSEWSTETQSIIHGARPSGISHDTFFDDARREMDRMREQFEKNQTGFGKRLPSQMPVGGTMTAAREFCETSLPRLDETPTGCTVTLNVPGFTEREIKIETRDDTLLLTGEHRSGSGETGHGRQSRSFQHRIRLESALDPASITSTIQNGVLRVSAQKQR